MNGSTISGTIKHFTNCCDLAQKNIILASLNVCYVLKWIKIDSHEN